MIDLKGEYCHKVDAKGRLALPAGFRRELQTKELVICVDPKDECLFAFEPEGFNEWVQSFFARDGGFDPRNEMHFAARRELKARGIDVEIDASGRINIPARLRQAVDIEKDVVVIGNTGYFEIWDAKRREEQKASVDLAALLFG